MMVQAKSTQNRMASQPPVRGAIVGQGAIGLFAASRLALANQPLALLLRDSHNPPDPRQRTSMTARSGLPIQFSVQSAADRRDYALLLSRQVQEPLDLLIVPVKAYAVQPAIMQYLPLLALDADIVLCHNGMGTIDPVAAALSSTQKLWFATTTHGAFKNSAFHVTHSGLGHTMLGPVNAAAMLHPFRFTQLLDCALGPLTLAPNMESVLWRKLAINALINPLTALLQCRNGELAKAQHQPQLKQLFDEFFLLATHAGQRFDKNELWQQIVQVIHATAQNYSSMQQDVKLKRPTELEFISGFLLQQANRYGVAVPGHQQLYNQLQAKIAML